MAHFGKRLAICSSAAFLAIAAGSAASATIIYQTGFEAPTYSLGGLAGQDGWNVFNNPAAVTVQNAIVASGAQAAMVNGALAPGQTGPWKTSATAFTKVSMSADILISSSASNRSWQFAALGAGLIGFAGGVNVGSNGTINAISGSPHPVIGVFSRDVFHNVDIRLDYAAQTFSVLLDGSLLVANLPFCGSNAACTGAVVPGFVNGLFDTFGANGGDVGVIDNYKVETFAPVPEPAAWAMMIAGFGLVGWTSRRRARPAVSFG